MGCMLFWLKFGNAFAYFVVLVYWFLVLSDFFRDGMGPFKGYCRNLLWLQAVSCVPEVCLVISNGLLVTLM